MNEEETATVHQPAPIDVAADVAETDAAEVGAVAAEAVEADAALPVPADESAPEPVETQTTLEVGLVRTVRFGPIMVSGAILVGLIAFIVTFFFPVEEDADYTVGQVAGFMAVVGAAAGLTLGGLLALILNVFAKRRTGAAVAVLTTVR